MSDLLAKLQVKPGQSIAVVGGAPEGADAWELSTEPSTADALLVYVSDAAALTAATPSLQQAAARRAVCWIAYPKAGQLGTDLNRDRIRESLVGLQPVRQVSIDEIWSALRLKPD
jgi:hypothetical protein